jgi:hypothetical protein
VTGPDGPLSKIDGRPLNAAKMAELKKFDEGGCGVSMMDSSGTRRGFAVARDRLPFEVPAIKHNPLTGTANGKVIELSAARANGIPLRLICWVPDNLTTAAMGKAFDRLNRERFDRIVAELHVARPLATDPALSREGQEFRLEMLAPEPVARSANAECVGETKPAGMSSSANSSAFGGCCSPGTIWTYSGDYITVNVSVCLSGGSCDDYGCMADFGYYEPGPPLVDMTSGRATDVIAELDTLTYTGNVSSSIPVEFVRWTWSPDPGTTDPWTHACAESSLSCVIEIHGSGTMRFTAWNAAGSDFITQHIDARPVDAALAFTATDVDTDSPSDPVAASSLGWLPNTQSANAPPAGFVDVSESQSRSILNAATATQQ